MNIKGSRKGNLVTITAELPTEPLAKAGEKVKAGRGKSRERTHDLFASSGGFKLDLGDDYIANVTICRRAGASK